MTHDVPSTASDTCVATLANGVRVVTLRLPHLESVSVSVFVRTGSAHEEPRLNGISHFVEHMAFKGTHERDCQRINLDAERLERIGHVAYAVRPSARHHGVGTAACAHALGLLRSHGLTRALITCEEGNLASAATIVRNGGKLDDVRGGRRRYWVDLT